MSLKYIAACGRCYVPPEHYMALHCLHENALKVPTRAYLHLQISMLIALTAVSMSKTLTLTPGHHHWVEHSGVRFTSIVLALALAERGAPCQRPIAIGNGRGCRWLLCFYCLAIVGHALCRQLGDCSPADHLNRPMQLLSKKLHLHYFLFFLTNSEEMC